MARYRGQGIIRSAEKAATASAKASKNSNERIFSLFLSFSSFSKLSGLKNFSSAPTLDEHRPTDVFPRDSLFRNVFYAEFLFRAMFEIMLRLSLLCIDTLSFRTINNDSRSENVRIEVHFTRIRTRGRSSMSPEFGTPSSRRRRTNSYSGGWYRKNRENPHYYRTRRLYRCLQPALSFCLLPYCVHEQKRVTLF